MNRKTIAILVAIYAIVTGLGYLAWIDRPAEASGTEAESASYSIKADLFENAQSAV